MGPHGEFVLSIEGYLITATLSGCFNEIGAQAYTQASKALIESLNGHPFAVLVNNLQVDGGVPEAFAILEAHNQWVSQQNIIAKAVVSQSQALNTITVARSPSMTKQNLALFTNIEDAINWLTRLLT